MYSGSDYYLSDTPSWEKKNVSGGNYDDDGDSRVSYLQTQHDMELGQVQSR